MDGTVRKNIKPGLRVDIVLKENQSTGKLTQGIVKDILTSSSEHHRGIKVRLESGQVGRVQKCYDESADQVNKDYYSKAEKFVVDSFSKANLLSQIDRFEKTVFWVKKLKPDADQALLIAAFAHDIERAFRTKEEDKKFSDQKPNGTMFLRHHQRRCAEIIRDFLESQYAPAELVERVALLVFKHEVGGDHDQDILMDADSISFLDGNYEAFVKFNKGSLSKDKIKEKFNWMYNRISTDEVRKEVKPLYERAMASLEK